MRFWISLLGALLLAISGGEMLSAAEHTKESLAEVKKTVDGKQGVLVDVREKSEWDQGHVEGAILLPLSALQNGAADEALNSLPKDKILYVHCVIGRRALTAGNVLERQGFTVRPLKPGYKELISSGFPRAQE